MSSKHIVATLGAAPHSLEAVLSRLVLLYRALDEDDETRQSMGLEANARLSAQLELLTCQMAWLRPAVQQERRYWGEDEAPTPVPVTYEDLIRQGLSEGELREAAGR